jgi:hypothetical protein
MKIIPNAFGERPMPKSRCLVGLLLCKAGCVAEAVRRRICQKLKLMYASVIRASDRWRGITVTPFELRQCHAIRDELDRRHREENMPRTESLTAKGIKQPKRAG